MESNEVILNNEADVIEESDGTFEVVTVNDVFSSTMKKLGVAFGCGLMGAAGGAVINVFVVPRIVKARGKKKAKKQSAETKVEVHEEERKNLNPYSAKTEEVFKSFKK